MLQARRLALFLATLAPIGLGGCGMIEPAEGDMQAAIRHTITQRYGAGAEVEYLDKISCHRRLDPAGYLCHFRLSTNTALPLVNEGVFYYDGGWRVRDLTLNPKFPE
jgi:hypothetical protein